MIFQFSKLQYQDLDLEKLIYNAEDSDDLLRAAVLEYFNHSPDCMIYYLIHDQIACSPFWFPKFQIRKTFKKLGMKIKSISHQNRNIYNVILENPDQKLFHLLSLDGNTKTMEIK